MTDEVVAALQEQIDPARVRSGATETRLYRRDASNMTGQAGVIVFAESTADVQAAVCVAARLGLPFLARGSGTGLAGGAVPPDGAIVISTSPDPSSQQTCSIGGNVANNSGGPHCLADGVTSAHVLALEVVLPDGSITVLGGEDPEQNGLDLRGVFVGSEGMFGVATKVCVRLMQNHPDVATMLMEFDSVAEGAQLVSDIIAAGIVPAAVEMMDQLCLQAVEAWLHAGLPTHAAAALLIECVGAAGQVASEMAQIRMLAAARGVANVRIAADEGERAELWKARKGAFGAVANVKPNYYLHDTVVPRARLAEVIEKVYEITARYGIDVINVFHAGDGNLHPLLVYDAREEGTIDKVHDAGREIVAFSVAVGGVLSGEHGIGLEKRDLMPLMFSEVDLSAQEALRLAFDPQLIANPNKVLPNPATCGDMHEVPDGAWI